MTVLTGGLGSVACCAHLVVYWTTQSQNGGQTRGWWQCGDCFTRFTPIAEFTMTTGVGVFPPLNPSDVIGPGYTSPQAT